jgi:hypothetical protein
MGGGLLQLQAYGTENIYLSGNPQIGMLGSGLGMGALAGVKNLRGQIQQVKPYTNLLEKGNYRKAFDEAVKNNQENQSFI